MAANPVNLSLASNPLSGTGSDLHELTQTPEFGDVNLGDGASGSTEIGTLAMDVLKAVLVAVAVKVLYAKVFK